MVGFNDTDDSLSYKGNSGLVKNRVIWFRVVEKVVNEILPWYRAKEIVPGIREIHYRLVAINSIPNNRSSYNQLSNHLVDARMSGIISWNDINDESRFVYNDNITKYTTPEDYLQQGIDFIKDAHETYGFPRWYSQENYVEPWTEKLAAVGTLKKFLKGKEVRIVPVRGFDGWGDAYKHALRLTRIRNEAIKNGR